MTLVVREMYDSHLTERVIALISLQSALRCAAMPSDTLNQIRDVNDINIDMAP